MAFERLNQKELNKLRTQMREAVHRPDPGTGSAFMHALSTVDRSLLSFLLKEERCPAGTVIFREGDGGRTVYLIRAGQIVAVRGDLKSPAILGIRGPGEVIGEMALLEHRPRSASVIALDDMQLLRIDEDGFRQLLMHSPAASMSIMATLSSRLREAGIVRSRDEQTGRKLASRMSTLQSEKQQLIELQQVRQETNDLIIHDLRNPLSLIYSAFQMLEMTLPEEVIENNEELFDVIRTSYTRMRRLVDSLLDVAKMEGDEARLDLAYVNLQDVIEEATRPAAFSLKQRNIEFNVLIPPNLPKLLIDDDKMIRVLGNLIDNAVKYMSSGGTLTIAACLEDDQVSISVNDTGPGIPVEERERVFERFAQVSGRGRPRGFGLGLVFCRLTVEAHGGRIWAEEGENGVGCRFIFTLPLPAEGS